MGHFGDTFYFSTITFTARGPLGPLSTSNSTLLPSSKASNCIPSKADRWKKTSLPSSALMNPLSPSPDKFLYLSFQTYHLL